MQSGKKLGAVLVEQGWASEEDITRARSLQFDVPYVDVADENPDPLLIGPVPGCCSICLGVHSH